MQKLDVETVHRITSRNKLRQYASPKKGRARILPFAQPRMRAGAEIAPEASFFVGGSCFARNIERALAFGGLPVLSSSEDTPMPSPPGQIAKWFNKFNTDTLLNEMRWAVQPEADFGVPSLVEFEGEYSDLQIGWSFAHKQEQAEFLRRAYCGAYSGANEADVVIITLGSIECWYDCEQQIYLNGMVPKRVSEQMPGRFEFHCFDFEDAYASLQRVYDHVMARPGKKPVLVFAVSAVAQPATYGAEDALVSNMASQAIQRAAAEQFVREHEDCWYFPAYEYCLLSDRRYSYHENTFNHVQQPVMDRAVANMLEAMQGPSEVQSIIAARGLVADHNSAGDPDKALAAVEKHDETYGDSAGLDVVRAQTFAAHDRHEAALPYYMRAARSEKFGTYSLWSTAVSAALRCKRPELAAEIVAIAEERGNDPERLAVLKERAATAAPAIAAAPEPSAPQLPRDELIRIHDTYKELLGSDPQRVVNELGEMLETGKLADDRFVWLYARALTKTDAPQAIAFLRELCAGEFKYMASAENTLNNLVAREQRLGRAV
ncbi:GSCFA domain-containing protein [Aliiruegeria sabulilitoris]|uniref:GSCFA domain-containing protein n=1 Tax=Aliiruegeria sabulilitoris TaxID=1510458 RepID=UPI000833CC04|nr:GSCFA domain-containing protein [Aliiruegeria sabulilitoris]NDR57567.1 GSCFA domain-containing protein [Pseudoruegeria sp. M32A2M]